MALDGYTISFLKDELANHLIGARIDKIFQPEPFELLLHIRQPGRNYRLVVSAHPQNARIHITSQSKENPLVPSNFCMLLRKHLEDGRIRAIGQPGLERIINMDIEVRDEYGDISLKRLVVEMMGKHSNIILLHHEGENSSGKMRIIDSIKRVGSAQSRVRQILPGREYLLPPGQGKSDPRNASPDDIEAVIKEYLGNKAISLSKLIINAFQGIGPTLADEMVFRAGLSGSEELSCNDSSQDELLKRIARTVYSLFSLSESDAAPTMAIERDSGRILGFSAIPLLHLEDAGNDLVRYDSISALLDEYYIPRDIKAGIDQLKNELLKIVQSNIDRCSKKLEIQKDALERAENADDLRIKGELLLASQDKVSKGSSLVRLPNYYSPELEEVEIEIDPALSAVENSRRYFKMYEKAKNSLQVTREQLRETSEELGYLNELLHSVSNASHPEELKEIKEEMTEQGYIKKHGREKAAWKKNSKENNERKYNFTSYKTRDGVEFLVGKNNYQNDYLTFKVARPGDVWFHAKDMPGSHVIMRKPGKAPLTEEDVVAGSLLAAYFSKGRDSSNVSVDYTERKNVKKPQGARPGFVTYNYYNTYYITPDMEKIREIFPDQF